jgi:hypothetical protein
MVQDLQATALLKARNAERRQKNTGFCWEAEKKLQADGSVTDDVGQFEDNHDQ